MSSNVTSPVVINFHNAGRSTAWGNRHDMPMTAMSVLRVLSSFEPSATFTSFAAKNARSVRN
jgi:hypothetical protein